MDSSRRAVESYWRSRMIDAATSDEDKVTPVYKLEEICELFRSSPAGIVKEVSEFVLKRLDHKSPIVKQKALRLIKYAVGKAGSEFRREMQRHSVAVKQLLHYKGQPDPLKGDALNKAVRETAQDALSAIFSTDDNKPATNEGSHRRMEGFGNPNFSYVPPPEEKKSLISEIVDLGSASLKQGLSTLAQGNSFKKNDPGSYRGPTLQKSLTNEGDFSDRYEKMDYHGGGQGSSGVSRNVTSGTWGQDSRIGNLEATNGDSNLGHTGSKTREERLLETIVTSGGVRLQPTRDALQAFVREASKTDALALCYALDAKLQSPMWQVRVKAVCVLEAILRKKDDDPFTIAASYFSENIDIVIKCTESPQASLREKANKVLSLLGGGHSENIPEQSSKAERTVVEMPNLIDAGDNDLLGGDDLIPKEGPNDPYVATAKSSSASPLIDDLFGGDITGSVGPSEHRMDDDPFADVSFHAGDDAGQGTDLFAGMTVGENSNASISQSTGGASVPFDIFGPSDSLPKQDNLASSVNNLMAGLSINENGSDVNQKATFPAVLPEPVFLGSSSKPGDQALNQSLSGGLDFQNTSINANAMFPMGAMPFNVPPGMLYNQFYPPQALNFGAMGGLLTQQQQQQFMAAMANFQSLGSFSAQNVGARNVTGILGGDSPAAFPDIFNANLAPQTATVTMNASKKETKAFDFISDHLTASRDPKRVI